VKCNIHAWMNAYFVVLEDQPRRGDQARKDGTFRLPDVPPGRYAVTTWHEVYGTQRQEVTLGGDETQNVNFVFRATP